VKPGRTIRNLILGVVVSGASLAAQQSAPAYPTPKGSPTVNGLAGFAKILCSAVFISGRNDAEAAKDSAYFFMPREEQDKVTWLIDRDQKVVTDDFRAGFAVGEAVRRSGLHHSESGQPGHPFHARRRAHDAAAAATQTGRWAIAPTRRAGRKDVEPGARVESAWTRVRRSAALTQAVSRRLQGTHHWRALRGRASTKDTQLESWSMGKSITATLFAAAGQRRHVQD
jgi:hypothetical protein